MLKLQIIGNVGNNAKVTETNGKKSINFSVASSRKITNTTTGEQKDITTWVECTIWRNSNESTEIAKYIEKGSKVYCEGLMNVSTYENKDKQTLASIKLSVQYIEFLSPKKQDEKEAETTSKNEKEDWEKPKSGNSSDEKKDDLSF